MPPAGDMAIHGPRCRKPSDGRRYLPDKTKMEVQVFQENAEVYGVASLGSWSRLKYLELSFRWRLGTPKLP
jgi:hypothetical protein